MAKKQNDITQGLSSELIDSYRRRNIVDRLRADNTTLLQEIELLNRRIETLIDLDYEYKSKPIKATNKAHSQATAVMLASDWHAEETVTPDTVNGLNEYNLKIFRKRAENFFDNGLRLVSIFQKDIQIKQIVLALLGDLITGYIHEELVEGNSLSPTQALLLVQETLIDGIKYLLEQSECSITIVCKFGNHGRTTQKSRIATAYKNSYEWLMYHMLAKLFNGEKRITWVIENNYYTELQIFNYLVRFHHGDWTRYLGGVGGLSIPLNKAIAKWNQNRVASLDVLGHYHSLMLDTGTQNFVVNGSLIGYSPYSIFIKAPFERPLQGLFLIDEKRGKTLTAPILVA